MKIRKQDGPPEDLLYFDEDLNLSQKQVEDVIEIFNTPLTGAYNWDYTVSDNRIKKLYELGKAKIKYYHRYYLLISIYIVRNKWYFCQQRKRIETGQEDQTHLQDFWSQTVLI